MANGKGLIDSITNIVRPITKPIEAAFEAATDFAGDIGGNIGFEGIGNVLVPGGGTFGTLATGEIPLAGTGIGAITGLGAAGALPIGGFGGASLVPEAPEFISAGGVPTPRTDGGFGNVFQQALGTSLGLTPIVLGQGVGNFLTQEEQQRFDRAQQELAGQQALERQRELLGFRNEELEKTLAFKKQELAATLALTVAKAKLEAEIQRRQQLQNAFSNALGAALRSGEGVSAASTNLASLGQRAILGG